MCCLACFSQTPHSAVQARDASCGQTPSWPPSSHSSICPSVYIEDIACLGAFRSHSISPRWMFPGEEDLAIGASVNGLCSEPTGFCHSVSDWISSKVQIIHQHHIVNYAPAVSQSAGWNTQGDRGESMGACEFTSIPCLKIACHYGCVFSMRPAPH